MQQNGSRPVGKKTGKKSDKKAGKKTAAKGGHTLCGSCKNFDPKKKGGWCKHHEKKRSADDKTCGHYDPR